MRPALTQEEERASAKGGEDGEGIVLEQLPLVLDENLGVLWPEKSDEWEEVLPSTAGPSTIKGAEKLLSKKKRRGS